MPRLWVPDRTIKRIKPPLGAEIDWSHPLARGLSGCWLFNEGGGTLTNLVTNNRETDYGTPAPTWGVSEHGLIRTFSGVNQGVKLQTRKYGLPGASGATIAAQLTYDATQADNPGVVLFIDRGSAGATRIALTMTNAGKLQIMARSVTETLQTTASTLTLTSQQWYHGVGVADLASAYEYTYINGKADNALSKTFTQTTFADTTPYDAVIATEQPVSGNYDYKGKVAHIYLWNRALTAGEVGHLYAEPFAFLKVPKRKTYWTIVAAGGGPEALIGYADSASTAAGTLSVARKLVGAAASASTAVGVVNVARKLVGAAASASTAAGVLVVARKLVSTAATASTATGVLPVARQLIGLAATASSASATFGGGVPKALVGTAYQASTAAGVLVVARKLVGAAATASSAVAVSSVARKLVGLAATASTATGTFPGTKALVGTADQASTATGVLKVARKLVGAAAPASAATGVVSVARKLVGAAATASTAAGVISKSKSLVGTAATASTAAGVLNVNRRLISVAVTASTASGKLIVQCSLRGTAAQVSLALAHLTALLALKGLAATSSTASAVAAAYYIPVVRRTWIARRGIYGWVAEDQLEWEAARQLEWESRT